MDLEQQARQAVLDALLGGLTLPGGVQPLLFPDIPAIAHSPTVTLLAEEHPGLTLPARVTLTPPAAVPAAALQDPSAPVLQFLDPEPLPDRVGVRLRVSRFDAQQRLVPLGEIVASFTVSPAGDLAVTEPTHIAAY